MKHKWQRRTHRVEVHGVSQTAKNCSACGMTRTKDPSTKSLDIFRFRGEEQWRGFKAGVVPPCNPPTRSPEGEADGAE